MIVEVEREERYWYPDEGGIVWLAGFQPVAPDGRYLGREAPELAAAGLRFLAPPRNESRRFEIANPRAGARTLREARYLQNLALLVFLLVRILAVTRSKVALWYGAALAVVLATASIAILLKAVMGKGEGLSDSFVSRSAIVRVITVLVPAIIYVGAVQFIGLYAASAAFIFFFMLFVGGESLLRAIGVALGVPTFFSRRVRVAVSPYYLTHGLIVYRGK